MFSITLLHMIFSNTSVRRFSSSKNLRSRVRDWSFSVVKNVKNLLDSNEVAAFVTKCSNNDYKCTKFKLLDLEFTIRNSMKSMKQLTCSSCVQ